MMNGAESINRIPRIRRTRDYRLYDFNGGRFLDLCLDGGRALLCHKHGQVILMMKNALEKGLSAPYPGVWEGRLLKQLKMLYPEIAAVSVVFAGWKSEAQSEAEAAADGSELPVFRPFEFESPSSEPRFAETPFKLLLPLPGSGMLKVICALEGCNKELPEPDSVPQYLYSGLARAAADLKAFASTVDTSVWGAFDSPLWTRRGPWLYPECSRDEYPKLFKAFISRGILLSPYYEIPSCAPYRFTDGEIKPIKVIEKDIL